MARSLEHALAQVKAELVAARERIGQLELENWRLRSEPPCPVTPGIAPHERWTTHGIENTHEPLG